MYALFVGVSILAVPGILGWILNTEVLVIIGFWGTWMYGCSLLWSKHRVFDDETKDFSVEIVFLSRMASARWGATLTLDACALLYLAVIVGFLVSHM